MAIDLFSAWPPGGSRAARMTLVAAAVLFPSACTVGPDFERPSPWSPASWFDTRPNDPKLPSLAAGVPPDPAWWSVFHDDTLTGLMRRLAASNLDVRAASIRLAESRAQRGIAAADEFPKLNGNGSYARERLSEKGVSGLLGSGGSTQTSSNGLGGRQGGVPTGGRSIPPFDLFQGGFDASWELDLWGRVRRAVEAADANLDSSAEARRQTLVTSLAELARGYVQLRGTQETLRIANGNLRSAQESANLSAERARGGLATDLDVANARAQVESTAAIIPQLEQQQEQGINAIALLLGAPPGALVAELSPPRPIPPVPPTVPVGIPSDLVRRRPDIRQTEALLHAATADIGQAEADFFPKVTLSGSLALQSVQFKDLGSWAARTYSLGPAITIPIFEGGRLRRTLELRKAKQQEAAINYQKTVLGAFHDVDNALIAYRAEQRRNARLAASVQQSRRALGLAQQRFRLGLSDYIEVLTAQRTVLQGEQQLSDSTTTISTNLVALYKALGGGWAPTYPDAPPPSVAEKGPG